VAEANRGSGSDIQFDIAASTSVRFRNLGQSSDFCPANFISSQITHPWPDRIRSKMYNLKCTDDYHYTGSEAIYVLDLIPLGTGLAAIASDQSLCLFDPTRLSHGPTKRIRTGHGNLAVAKAYNAAESIVATTGENGSVSLWDLRLAPTQASVLQLAGELTRHILNPDPHED
jgi:WD40 repeat protein